MSCKQRKNFALEAIQNRQIITNTARKNNVSRKFIHRQESKAIEAVNQVFNQKSVKDDNVLFYLPVTKSWLCQLILCLMLHCRASFRGITKLLKDVFDYSVPVGTIHNISQSAKEIAETINAKQDLTNIKLATNDELFHFNKPVLAGVDIPSLYCYLLLQEQQRDDETWAIHLWYLEKQGFNPERIIADADDGHGLRAGHKLALPNIPCDIDNFYITKRLC